MDGETAGMAIKQEKEMTRNRVEEYLYIVEGATEIDRKWSNREVAHFHYLNPNGMVAHKRNNDKRISEMVRQYGIPNGCIIAYGTLNTYEEDALMELVKMQRVSSIKLHVVLGMLAKAIESQVDFISRTEAAHEKGPYYA